MAESWVSLFALFNKQTEAFWTLERGNLQLKLTDLQLDIRDLLSAHQTNYSY